MCAPNENWVPRLEPPAQNAKISHESVFKKCLLYLLSLNCSFKIKCLAVLWKNSIGILISPEVTTEVGYFLSIILNAFIFNSSNIFNSWHTCIFFFLKLKLNHIWLVRDVTVGSLLNFFDLTPAVFYIALAFWYNKMLWDHLSYILAQKRNWPFIQKTLVPF